MNIWNNIRLFFSSLFQGLASADDVIQGHINDDSEKTIGIHQVKDIHRVAPALLRGEVTKEVAELRYRDYLVSEASRHYDKYGNLTTYGLYYTNEGNNYKFTGVNHEICASITDSNVFTQSSYTLKITYEDSVKFLLEKYCDNFSVDKNFITLRFSTLPNRNVITSKAFCNYLKTEMMNNSLGGTYSRLKEIKFVSYKISSIPNYLEFKFEDLILTEVFFDDEKHECVMKYSANFYTVEDLTKKYVVDELKDKYSNKEAKYLPQESFNVEYKLCEICGSPMLMEAEGKMNQEICGKFCCTSCCCDELMKKENIKEK